MQIKKEQRYMIDDALQISYDHKAEDQNNYYYCNSFSC